MGSLKPRKRLVNFRLTQEEYDRLAAVCARKGVPSISDFTRSAILRTVESESRPEEAVHRDIAHLDQRVAKLETGLRRLARSTQSVVGGGTRRRTAPAELANLPQG